MDMDALLAASDIVSLHARVTPETRGFIGEHQFRTMKRGAYFMNTARGPMVDYDALYRVLVDGHLAGAALETFAVEPAPADLPLLRLPNVTLTPHIAGCSRESVLLAADMVCSDLAAWYTGAQPQRCYNPEALGLTLHPVVLEAGVSSSSLIGHGSKTSRRSCSCRDYNTCDREILAWRLQTSNGSRRQVAFY